MKTSISLCKNIEMLELLRRNKHTLLSNQRSLPFFCVCHFDSVVEPISGQAVDESVMLYCLCLRELAVLPISLIDISSMFVRLLPPMVFIVPRNAPLLAGSVCRLNHILVTLSSPLLGNSL